jgi:hypothetical protein
MEKDDFLRVARSLLGHMYSGAKVVCSARRPFTVEEDVRLLEVMVRIAVVNWNAVAQQVGGRSARQCRERWVNYLNPKIRNEPWTEDEDRLLVDKINECGHSWASIGKHFNGRSESDVKNRWYSHLRYQTVSDSGRLTLVTRQHEKRTCGRTSPQVSALRMLGRQCAPVRLPLVEPILPTLAKQQNHDATNEDRSDVLTPESEPGNGI